MKSGVCVCGPDDVNFRHVWARHMSGRHVLTHRLSQSPWDVTLGYPTTMNEFTFFMDVMLNLFIHDMFL